MFILVKSSISTEKNNRNAVKMGIVLLLKLSNVLYFESIFNGFFFILPSFTFILLLIQFKICQSPLIHLASLNEKLLYLDGTSSKRRISVASALLK